MCFGFGTTGAGRGGLLLIKINFFSPLVGGMGSVVAGFSESAGLFPTTEPEKTSERLWSEGSEQEPHVKATLRSGSTRGRAHERHLWDIAA